MSNVPLSRRKPSPFQAQHNFYALRDEVTTLMLLDFGFSKEKYEAQIARYHDNHKSAQNVDEVVARYKAKADAYYKWFVDKECDAVLSILRDIESEFTIGNSIYPSNTIARIFEYLMRRKHINTAIAKCYVLKQELNYIIRTLPVDINKFARFSKAIDKQIDLYKGVRQADNRFLRTKKKDTDPTEKDISVVLNAIMSLINRIVSQGNS